MCARTSQLIVSDFEKAKTFVKLDHFNICRMQRCIPDALQDAWSQLPAEKSVAVNYLGSSGESEPEEALSAILGMAAVGSEDVVLEELVHLGRWFQELVGAKAVNTRLEIMDQKLRCPLYHMDKVALRLSVSYVGPGTQFLPEEDVRRAAMLPWVRRGKTLEEINDAVQRPACAPQVAQVGDVLLMKGEAWNSDSVLKRLRYKAAVHRSPPFTGRRVLLTMDPL